MGTTSPKGLRYPEPTALARTLHTQIKNLADDMNAALVAQDVRLLALDNKTDATNTVVNNQTGMVLARYGNAAGVFTHSPNDGGLRTINQHTDQFYIPTNAKVLVVSFENTAFATANAAGAWYPLVSLTTGGGNWIGLGEYVTHNQAQPGIDLGFNCVHQVDVRNNVGNFGSVALNHYADMGSASWITNGFLRWSATLLG